MAKKDSIVITNALGTFTFSAIMTDLGSEVDANPTLSGNEAALAGIGVNGTNYAVKTYLPFNSSWVTDGTIKQFCDSVNGDASAVAAKVYLGELTCSDLPDQNLVNVDAVVEVIDGEGTSGKVIHVTVTSGSIAPYRWEYTYWNNGVNVSGWVKFAQGWTVTQNQDGQELGYDTYTITLQGD